MPFSHLNCLLSSDDIEDATEFHRIAFVFKTMRVLKMALAPARREPSSRFSLVVESGENSVDFWKWVRLVSGE